MPLEYYSYPETFDLDRELIGHALGADLACLVFSPGFVVTGDSGATYNLARSFGMPRKGTVLNLGIYRGSEDMATHSELAVPFSHAPAVQPYTMQRSGDAVVYETATCRITVTDGGYQWHDAGGRIELEVERLGNPCGFSAPAQDGVEQGFTDRSHVGKVTGVIDGDPVEGVFVADLLYSKPAGTFYDIGLYRYDNYWVGWLVEYEDGTREGGTAWRGRPGTGFAFANHFAGDSSRARSDARLEVNRADSGAVSNVELSLGEEVSVSFEARGVIDWPFHSYGHATRTSRTSRIANSWCYMENWPLRYEHIEHYQAAYRDLYGRYPSFKTLLAGARIEDGALILQSNGH